jgi:hypothetical protein
MTSTPGILQLVMIVVVYGLITMYVLGRPEIKKAEGYEKGSWRWVGCLKALTLLLEMK